MTMRWTNTINVNLEAVGIMVRAHVEDALEQGGQIIRDRSDEIVPFEVGVLASTVRVKESRGGVNTVAITYDGPYARYQHENLGFRHLPGRVAKFLELAMIEKGESAINKTGEHIWGHIASKAWGDMG